MKIDFKAGTVGFLDLTFGPTWDYIHSTRTYLENFLIVNMKDRKRINQITVSASELLENAVRHSPQDGVRFILKKSADKDAIEISVYNYATKESANILIDKIKDMNNHDSLQYYILKMKEKDVSGGLGLARVYHEGAAKITGTYFEKEGVLEIKAIFEV